MPSVAQMLPLPVERLPLFHWRPGARLLCLGSRDGARFDGQADPAEARSFQRQLSQELLTSARQRGRCSGYCAAWDRGLGATSELSWLLAHADAPLAVISAGHGDAGLLAELLPRVVAWLLLVDDRPGPCCERILSQGQHVEILCCAAPPAAWQPSGVHVVARQATEDPEAPRRLAAALRQQSSLPIYDDHHSHSHCPCGATLVWRHGGRSRLDALTQDERCRDCGRRHQFDLEKDDD